MLRIIPALEKQPTLLRLVATTPGRLVAVLVFGVLLAANRQGNVAPLTLILLTTALLPKHRRVVVSIATIFWTAFYGSVDWKVVVGIGEAHGVASLVDNNIAKWATTLAVVTCALAYEDATRAGLPFAKGRPVLALVVGYIGLLAVVSYVPFSPAASTLLWGFAIVFSRYLWFIAFALIDGRSPDRPGVLVRIGEHAPFWMTSSHVPHPKGGGYLRKVECKDDAALAICQLKAIKLLLWTTVLRLGLYVFQRAIYGETDDAFPFPVPRLIELPALGDLLVQTASGHAAPAGVAWASIVANFLSHLTNLTIEGHYIIAICRMAGFAALRNTHAPLKATSLAEFWNRLYYYFKELLVDVFYFPTFLTFFKKHPRLRMFFATLAAAGFGNFVYHFLARGKWIAEEGLVRALAHYHVYAVYCLILGGAIAFSELRARGKKRQLTGLPRLFAMAQVTVFYCLIGILDVPGRGISLVEYGPFIKSLVGVH